MKDLIEEIEKLKRPDTKVSFDDGFNRGIDKIINLLNRYNIITAPKQIKLSEIVDILKEYYHTKIEIIKKSKKYYDCYLVCRKSLVDKEEYELLIRNNVIEDIDEFCCYPKEDIRKWLYTLWITGTEVEDDMKEDENE